MFGVQVRGFDRAYTHVASVNEGCLQKEDLRLHRQHVTLTLDGEDLAIPVDYHEFLRPQDAETWGVYRNAASMDITAVSCRQQGKGRAIYVGVPLQEELLTRLLARCGVTSPFIPPLPEGISAAQLQDTATLYVNRTALTKQIPVQGHTLLGNHVEDGLLTLPPYEADIIES
ncbi:MAG TPA: beta-galactosidase trimerization domain-containing protein [Firmicutes bacterium]|nr:beta-galactosidase trimerization domain-containing protein [Bacillota bacterium]